jgi:hypothetical protein
VAYRRAGVEVRNGENAMTSRLEEAAKRLYMPWEQEINSWQTFQLWLDLVTNRSPDVEVVWRGARRAEWGITTSLYRALNKVLGHPPNEDQMVQAEENTLKLARREWRFDHLTALELFAHVQHLGGPTRLLDVSANPLIAAWFAVERNEGDDNSDGRLFAFSARGRVDLRPIYNGRSPRWHSYKTDSDRQAHHWGTGQGRRLWRPPAYNGRIPAQNSAFIMDGVPLPDATPPRLLADESEKWDLDELREVSSFNLRPSSLVGTRSVAPVFTARIEKNFKREFRHLIEDRYGYTAASLYSDLEGLASYIARRPEVLLDTSKTR